MSVYNNLPVLQSNRLTVWMTVHNFIASIHLSYYTAFFQLA